MTPVERQPDEMGLSVGDAAACPPPGRFWGVALGLSWTSAEQAHVQGCSRCHEIEQQIRAAVASSAAAESTRTDDMSCLASLTLLANSRLSESPDNSTAGLHAPTLTTDCSEIPIRPRWSDLCKSGSTGVPGAIGRYQVIQLLGQGGMGMVYLGRDAELERPVAIKVSPALGPADSSRLDRFLREARVVARLEHPAILPIYDVGQTGDAIYIVSRFIDGTDLATRVGNGGPLAPGEAAALIEQVARGVHHAHRARGLAPRHQAVEHPDRSRGPAFPGRLRPGR